MPNLVPVTDPVILDRTGQDIVDALNEIKEGVQPSNIYLDMEISIPVNGWSSTAPYTYTWLNSRITTECGVEVHFKDGAETIDMSYLEYEKTIGGIIFTIDKVPNAAVPLVIRIINAKADAIIDATSADMVTTSAVPEASNVEEALTIHQTKVTENAEDIASLETAMDAANDEIAIRAKSLNGVPCDEYGDFHMYEVEFARQLITDDAQQSTGEFLFRTTGGDASLTDGPAKLVSIQGRSIHTGEVAESLNMTVTMAERGQLDEPIEATINRDTFVSYVDESGTTTLTYTDSWSEDPADYGITVTGSPIDGDVITVVYVKGDRGTITNSNPSAFTSTGWNLYNNAAGVKYARVKKYSDTYGFIIGGSYSGIEFSPTLNGSRESITPASGYFTIPSDGYVFVSNGDDTTYILMTWSDWGEGYEGSFQNYSETTVSLSTIMSNFPYGLMQVGSIADEINFSMKLAISRIERLAYTEENLEAVIASGVAYDADENYIYAVKVTEDSHAITETGDYTASDHGIEFITGGTVPVFVLTLYGQNLVDKLRTDVLTKSNDLVNNLTTNDPNKALSAAQGYALNSKIEKKTIAISGVTTSHTLDTNASLISKIAEIVYMRMSITLTSNVAAFGTIATLPTDARPNIQYVGFMFDPSYNPLPFDITSNGAIRIWKAATSGQALNMAIVYFAQ